MEEELFCEEELKRKWICPGEKLKGKRICSGRGTKVGGGGDLC